MGSPFIAEIRIFPFSFAPRGWAQCNGQLLSIAQNTALFSLIGTYYGGDGRTTFGLPNLQGRAPMGQGQGSGLSPRYIGESGGSQVVTLIGPGQVPLHEHTLKASAEAADLQIPNAARSLAGSVKGNAYKAAAPDRTMSLSAVGLKGGSQPHNNMQPYLTLNICICLQGVYPKRP
jgi:microcystin-dependent protein